MREWTETQGSPPSCTRLERYTTRNCRYSLMMIRTKLSKSHRVPQRLLSVSSIDDSELGGCREFWGFRKLILHRTGTWSSGAVFPFLSRRDLRASSSLYRLHPFYQFFFTVCYLRTVRVGRERCTWQCRLGDFFFDRIRSAIGVHWIDLVLPLRIGLRYVIVMGEPLIRFLRWCRRFPYSLLTLYCIMLFVCWLERVGSASFLYPVSPMSTVRGPIVDRYARCAKRGDRQSSSDLSVPHPTRTHSCANLEGKCHIGILFCHLSHPIHCDGEQAETTPICLFSSSVKRFHACPTDMYI